MSAAAAPPAFSRGGAFALVAGGFALFIALLYLIAADADFAGERGRGQAHAASNGLNGYSGLARLVEAQGYRVQRARSAADLDTPGVLVITPGFSGEGKEVSEIITRRRFVGPTLVILSKWWTDRPAPDLPPEAKEKFRKGWVTLGPAEPSGWPEVLPTGYHFRHKLFPAPEPAQLARVTDPDTGRQTIRKAASGPPAPPPAPGRWSGMGRTGVLPAAATLHAEPAGEHEPLITDQAGRVLAFAVGLGTPGPAATPDEPVQPVIFLAEPDLANNYGLADPQRAAAAIALVDALATAGDSETVVFDLSLAGFGASENLLTLAFRPPFLAATLSLAGALLIVVWRAFRRFGPAASAQGAGIAFGKRQLIHNGAGLILRARRFTLLGAPYAALVARRLAERLGLARPDPHAIDAALARRLPEEEEPFTRRAARLEAARRPAEILAAARALDDLATRLQQGQTSR